MISKWSVSWNAAPQRSRILPADACRYSGFGLKSPRVRQVDAHNGRQGSKEMDSSQTSRVLETNIPARLERLPWGRFHTFLIIALGITWTLDGLEVTLAGAVSPALKESASLHISNADVGLASSGYLAGAVLGALFFG